MPITNGIFEHISGTTKTGFFVGGPIGLGIKLTVGGDALKTVDPSDNLMPHLVLPVVEQSARGSMASTQYDLQSKFVEIETGADGDSFPAASSYAEKYIICKKSGGSKTEGEIYYSDGSSWKKIPISIVVSHITTKQSVDMETMPDLEVACLYAWDGEKWALRGRSSTDVGLRVIKVLNIGTSTKYSSATFDNGDYVEKVVVKIKTAYSSNTGYNVKIGSTTLASSASKQIDPLYTNTYVIRVDDILSLGSPTPVTVEISGTPTEGTSEVYVIGGTGEI